MTNKTIATDLSAPPSTLSPREREVAERLALGWTNREIGAHFGISTKTIDTHRAHVLRKLRIRNNADVARWAVAHGVIAVDAFVEIPGAEAA